MRRKRRCLKPKRVNLPHVLMANRLVICFAEKGFSEVKEMGNKMQVGLVETWGMGVFDVGDVGKI